MTDPRPQAPEGRKPSNQDLVDWRARSQGLEEALRRVYDVTCCEEDAVQAATRASHIVRDALAALGLPDEEGEDAEVSLCPGCDYPLPSTESICPECGDAPGLNSGYGGAAPPRGAAREITFEDKPDENARVYRHEGCSQVLYFGGTRPNTQWVEPLDDCPPPADAECPECIQVLPCAPFEPEAAGTQPEPDRVEAISKDVRPSVRDVTGEGER